MNPLILHPQQKEQAQEHGTEQAQEHGTEQAQEHGTVQPGIVMNIVINLYCVT